MIEPPSSQRSATRAPIEKPIRLQFDDSLDVDEGHCINISIGGMFVHADSPRPPGTLVRFELPIHDELSIRGLGEVVWQQRVDAETKGVGIKFRFLEQRDRQQIFKLVSQHIKARLERESEPPPEKGDGAPLAPEAAAFMASPVEVPADPDADDTKSAITRRPVARADAEQPSLPSDAGLEIDQPQAEYQSQPAAEDRMPTPPEPPIAHGEPAGAEPAADGPIVVADDPGPGLFDRWQQPDSDIIDGSKELPAEPGVSDWTPGAAGLGVEPVARGAGASGRRRPIRRRRDTSWMIAAAIAIAAVAVGAFLLRDRLFPGAAAGDQEALSTTRPVAPPAASPAADVGAPSDAETLDTHTDTTGPDTAAVSPPSSQVAPPTLPAAPPEQRVAQPRTPPPPITAPAPDVPAEPLPASGQRATKVNDIQWRSDGDQLTVTVALDGSIADQRLRRFRLGGGAAREVLVLVGMAAPYRQTQMAVDRGGVATIRIGFHRKPRGDELHIVLDLADSGKTIAELRNRGDRIDLVIGDSR